MTDLPRIGRPRGELRTSLAAATRPIVQERGCFSPHDAALAVSTTVRDARSCLRDMARAGELLIVGSTRVPGVNRPVNLYAPARPSPHHDPATALQMAMRTWRDFV